MKKYTITDKEWESVLNKVQTLEKENQRLTGVIEGMNKAFSLCGVSQHSELLKAFLKNADDKGNIVLIESEQKCIEDFSL